MPRRCHPALFPGQHFRRPTGRFAGQHFRIAGRRCLIAERRCLTAVRRCRRRDRARRCQIKACSEKKSRGWKTTTLSLSVDSSASSGGDFFLDFLDKVRWFAFGAEFFGPFFRRLALVEFVQGHTFHRVVKYAPINFLANLNSPFGA